MVDVPILLATHLIELTIIIDALNHNVAKSIMEHRNTIKLCFWECNNLMIMFNRFLDNKEFAKHNRVNNVLPRML